MTTYTIGADPEVFVAEQGRFVSAHNLIEGTKQNPYPVKDGAVQVDGMALEFNIDPCSNEWEFTKKMQSVSDQLAGMIGDRKFITDCSVFFEDNDIKDVPAYNLELGCMPDFNGYTLEENPMPDASMNMRTAGGHIHIGGFHTENEWDMKHFALAGNLARAMDRHVGIYSLLWDKDDKRRSLYGKAGAFRSKTYGMEYRTLSNAWIFSKDLISFVYQQTKKAIDSVVEGETFETDFFADIINNSRRDSEFLKLDPVAQKVRGMVNG